MPARPTRTLDRLLSRAGVCSRTVARQAIAAGRVQVDGRVVRDPEAWVDASRAVVCFDGTEVRERPKEVWLLHKPTGFVTTASDERGRATVYELLPAGHTWLAPVGRLDRDTSGLLLFTNDSDLADAITAPASKLPKTYVARCRGRLHDDAIAALAAGVPLPMARPCRLRCSASPPPPTTTGASARRRSNWCSSKAATARCAA